MTNYINIAKEMNVIDGWNNKQDLTKYNFIDLFAGGGDYLVA